MVPYSHVGTHISIETAKELENELYKVILQSWSGGIRMQVMARNARNRPDTGVTMVERPLQTSWAVTIKESDATGMLDFP